MASNTPIGVVQRNAPVTVVAGDSINLRFELVTPGDNQPVDLTGFTIEADAVGSESGEVTDLPLTQDGSSLRLALTPQMTAALDQKSEYDIRFSNEDGSFRTTPLKGEITISKSITVPATESGAGIAENAFEYVVPNVVVNLPAAAVPAAPANVSAPSISGDPLVGETLTADPGLWTGSPSPTFAYEWRRDGAPISGATGQTYTAVAADDQTDLTVAVTGSNSEGDSPPAESAAVSITYAAPTTNGTIPDQQDEAA